MMDSTDNTNELDSYGVWVKRQPASDENNLSPETEDPSSNFDIDSAFDIPDIEETIEETNSDSALNFDSVLDIPVETPENEALEESISEEISDEINLEDFEEINLDSNTSSESEESFTDVSDSEINEVNNTDTIEEVSDFELPSEDGEISLDDFLEDGFSDESVASGNNGLGETVEDGEISLDDFLDGGDFTSGPAETKEEEIVDEKPLEMDISFDNSIDSIETEENDQSDSVIFDDDEPPVQENIETEDVSNSFFEEHGSTEISSGSTEEIDLSDFGIDADAEETPITQDVEESKMRDSVIDYDLCVSDENLSSAPVVNEIKDKEPSKEDIVNTETVTAVATAAAAAAAGAVIAAKATEQSTTPQENKNDELLQQIIDELAGMKNEINNLKSNLEEIKSHENSAVSISNTEENIIPGDTEDDESGFFSETDGDDTIALSGNELDNIMNNVEFKEETENSSTEEIQTEEKLEDDFVIPDSSENETSGFFDDDGSDDTIALSGNELDNIMSNVSFSEEQTTEETNSDSLEEDFLNDDIPNEIDIEPVSTETISDDIFGNVEDDNDIFNSDENDLFEDFPDSEDEEVMEEPDLNDIHLEDNDETSEDELPDEIEIPKLDDILVESSSDDLLNSVNDNTENEDSETLDDIGLQIDISEEITEENNEEISKEIEEDSLKSFDDFMKKDPSLEESLTESHISYLNEETEKNDENEEDTTFPDVDLFGETDDTSLNDVQKDNETTFESSVSDETVEIQSDETPVIIEEEPVFEEETSVDINDEPLNDENDDIDNSEISDNSELRQDIKSVLRYMDQLLENLPEDKIVEFAKSEEFTTYKKLFTELGLSD